MNVQITNICNEFTQDVKDFHTKPYLLAALKSHVRQSTNGIPRDTIERAVNAWFSTLLANPLGMRRIDNQP